MEADVTAQQHQRGAVTVDLFMSVKSDEVYRKRAPRLCASIRC